MHPVNGGGYDRFSEPLRKFWSRRRQSTSVNGVCQVITTISSILDDIGGIKDHNSQISGVENGVCGLEMHRGVCKLVNRRGIFSAFGN